jgi:hypothetical protein
MLQTTVLPSTAARHRVGGKAFDPLRIVAAAAAQVYDWATAAEGRRRTEGALRALERAGWRVAHSVALPDGGRVDHLAVGPGGVYVLDSKAWRGVVTVDHKGATITPEHDPDAAWTARGQHRSLPPLAAAAVRALTAATGGPLPAPCAVVVIWAPFPDRVAVSGGVTYVAGEHLTDWLLGQPARLDAGQLAALWVGATPGDLLLARPPRTTA